MPKAKLVLTGKSKEQVKVASHFSGVTVIKAVKLGDEIHMEISGRSTDALVSFGRYLEKVTGTELVEEPAPATEPAKETKKK